jgi:uroporphyrinogen decarboxylase
MPSCFNTTPDYRRLEIAIKRGKPDRTPVYEFFSDTSVQLRAIGDTPMTDTLPLGGNPDLDGHIQAQYYLGYDYLSPSVGFCFTGIQHVKLTDVEGFDHYFVDEVNKPITGREDFEAYPWPNPDMVDYGILDYCASHLPEGMKCVCNLGGGLLEWGMWLVGAEQFCLMVYDDPDLVRDVLTRINDQQVAVAKQVAGHPEVFAVAMGDDMGFKTQTFLPPAALREFVFPGLKRLVDAVHDAGKPFILHSCGNLELVMDDLIDFVGIDAKHSFEDVIMPVVQVQERWGDRVALLGGIDVDKICRMGESELRAYVREVTLTCGARGGFAVGSGNSIANYIPPKSLRIMLDEAINCQR